VLGYEVSIEKCISINVYAASGRFFHLACAAFFALALRCFAVILSALALPPLDAPSLDNATAAGFFFRSSGGFSNGVPSHFSPIRSSITDRASRFGSVGRLLLSLRARVGMVRLWHTKTAKDGHRNKTPHEIYRKDNEENDKTNSCRSFVTPHGILD